MFLPHSSVTEAAGVFQETCHENPPLDCIKLPGVRMQSYCQKGRICTDLGAWSVTATDAAQAAAPQTVAQAVGHSEGTWFSHSLSNTERKILRSL